MISKESIICEIGDVLTGNTIVRTSNDDITVYDSTGIGLQDIAVGNMAIKKAKMQSHDKSVQF